METAGRGPEQLLGDSRPPSPLVPGSAPCRVHWAPIIHAHWVPAVSSPHKAGIRVPGGPAWEVGRRGERGKVAAAAHGRAGPGHHWAWSPLSGAGLRALPWPGAWRCRARGRRQGPLCAVGPRSACPHIHRAGLPGRDILWGGGGRVRP